MVRIYSCCRDGFSSILLNKLFKTQLSDVLYSLKAIERNKFLELKTEENHFGIELDIILRALKNKYKIVEMQVERKKEYTDILS